MKKVLYPNIWGEGALFAVSGYDGKTDFSFELLAKLLGDRAGLSIYTGSESGVSPSAEFWIESDGCGLPAYDKEQSIVSGDFIELTFKAGKIYFSAVDCRTFTGFCGSENTRFILKSAAGGKEEARKNIVFIKTGKGFIAASATAAKRTEFYLPAYEFKGKFAVTLGKSRKECRVRLKQALANNADLSQAAKNKTSFTGLLPDFINRLKDNKIRRTAAKAVSVLKVNVQSPYKIVPLRWTTPDRLPHHDMWLWDSAFHSMGWSYLDTRMASDAICAVFKTQRRNGFIPICARHKGNQTQPPILAWSVWHLYTLTKDESLLRQTYEKLANFLGYFEKNRREKKTGLYFWKKEMNRICRAGESGLDNSPLYDGKKKQLSCDLSSYMANSFELLAKMAEVLEKDRESRAWREKYKKLKSAMNKLLWDGRTGFYYDREINGQLLAEKSATGFYPLFAGVVSKPRAAALLKHLKNKEEFWTAFPVPTVSRESAR
ncbi:MAG: trehalase family glycosidase, partial [Candidatus Firestonebacteria bacterium]